MSPRLFTLLTLRAARGARARLLLFVACMSVGVAAVVGVSSVVDAVEHGIRARSRELLGGDLAVEARRSLPDVEAALPARYRNAPRVALSILPSMVRSERGLSRLAEIKAVDWSHGTFPLAGTLELAPQKPLTQLLPDDHSALVAPSLLRELGLAHGDTLYLGGQPFTITGSITREPDPLTFSFSFGPRVLIRMDGLLRTKLLGFGNRVRYRNVYAFPRASSDTELKQLKHDLSTRLPGGQTFVTIETHAEAQPALQKTLERVQRYVGLLSLLSLLIGSVGVAQIVSAWIAQAAPNTAILRCLGLSPREVLLLYLAQTSLFSLLGSLCGAAIGSLLPFLVGRAYPALLPASYASLVSPYAVLRGVLLGVGVSLAFSLPALASLFRISPARVLRAEAEPLPIPRSYARMSALAAASAAFLAAYWQSASVKTAGAFTLSIAACALLLWGAAKLLLKLIARLPRDRLPVVLWQGAAALTRPVAGTSFGIVALGLGTLVVTAITLIEAQLAEGVETALPRNAPSVFLVDVQVSQWPEIEQLAKEHGAQPIEGVPVVMARLAALDGRSVSQLLQARPGDRNEKDRAHWVLTREQRISFRSQLPNSNHLVACTFCSRADPHASRHDGSGPTALWSAHAPNELSLERDFARDLGAQLGSRVRFDIQGIEREFVVTSLREVDWRSFAPNFLILAEPGSLDDAPQIRLGALRMPERAEAALQDAIARAFPNVTVLRVAPLLAKLREVLDDVALAVRVLGGFAALTGLIMLVGSIASTQLRRAREVALMKALGVARTRIVLVLALEYALGGALAATLGTSFAYLLAFVFTRQLLELSVRPSPWIGLACLAATAIASVVGGLIASMRALLVSPGETLRAD
jgi:putative ABC transport system permease protein